MPAPQQTLLRVGRSAFEDESFVAIAAFDKAFFVDFEPDARMPKCRAARNVGRAIARHAVRGNESGFRRLHHERGDSNGAPRAQRAKEHGFVVFRLLSP